jgi:hypothetical protein
MPEVVLTIHNQHSKFCGNPPSISNESGGLYVGYFENPFGEQWIFTYNPMTSQALLRGGDVDWEMIHEVREGRVPELVMSREELQWLQACWSASHLSERARHVR